jgi:uncharacterized SAM-binding protein YcdF (DUF218 family)
LCFRPAKCLLGGITRRLRLEVRRRFFRRALIGALILVVVFAAATARLFVWPPDGAPDHVDAILMTASPYTPVTLATRLARTLGAKYLLISLGHDGYGGKCPRPVPDTRLICFDPSPATTQGEAEYAGRLAAKYGWSSILVISIAPQEWRAEQRLRRCFHGSVYGAAGGIPLNSWPYEIAYEWGATFKMLIWQRSC